MATPEAKVKAKIKALLKQHGAYFTMPVMAGLATNGTPDFSVCHVGRYLGLEAKAGTGQPTALQWLRMDEIVAAGGCSMVVNEAGLELLEQWLKNPSMRVAAVKHEANNRLAGHRTRAQHFAWYQVEAR